MPAIVRPRRQPKLCSPSYVELLAGLEMARDARALGSQQPPSTTGQAIPTPGLEDARQPKKPLTPLFFHQPSAPIFNIAGATRLWR